jgi:hypothetical protein
VYQPSLMNCLTLCVVHGLPAQLKKEKFLSLVKESKHTAEDNKINPPVPSFSPLCMIK